MNNLQMTPDEREYWRRMNNVDKVVHILPSVQYPLREVIFDKVAWALDFERQVSRFTAIFFALPVSRSDNEPPGEPRE